MSGVAGKGLLLNAIVNFYAVTNGTVGTTSLAGVRTDAATGAFTASIAATGVVVVTVTTDSNTQMLDELSGVAGPAPSGLVLHAVLGSLTNLQPIAVTPLTEMVYDLGSAQSGGLTSANISVAETAVDGAFLDSTSSLATQPIALAKYKTAPIAQQELAKLLVAFAVAANEGTATGVSGSACNGSTYAERLVCMIGGLGQLVTLNSSGQGALSSSANYVAAAYAEISNDDVQINGGQLPSVLGVNVATPAETTLAAALGSHSTLPGYDASAAPVSNTEAFFADIRTNIVDQSTSTFGLAPTVSALSSDFKTNVAPALANTGLALAALKHASDLLLAAAANPSVVAGSTANLQGPSGFAFDTDGNMYVADFKQNTVVAVTTAGKVTGFAGTPDVAGSSDGVGAAAQFDRPNYIATDSSGAVYVVDVNNFTIRKITNPGAVVTTIAGQAGVSSYGDGVGSAATFSYPQAIAADGSGNLYVTDGGAGTIRKLTPSTGSSGTVYTVTTIAGQPGVYGSTDGPGSSATFNFPEGIAIDAAGNIWVSDVVFSSNGQSAVSATIREIVPNSNATAYTVTTIAGQAGSGTAGAFLQPLAITFDHSGNLWIADYQANIIQKLTLGVSPSVVTIAGTASTTGGYVDGAGTAALFNGPDGLAFDAAGNLYVADYSNNAIRKLDPSGNVTTVAHSTVAYLGSTTGAYCGYDPATLGTGPKTAECRYGDYANPLFMTVTQSAAGTFAVTTQPLTGTANSSSGQNPILEGYQVSTSIAALDSSLTITNGTGAAQTAVFSGPFYVTGTGGQVTANLTVGQSSDWNAAVGTGTLTASGGITNGSGGISLTSASFGTNSSITVQNFAQLLKKHGPLTSLAATPSIQGNLNVSALTAAFSYDADFSIGAPTLDKSGKLAVPSSVSLSGSVGQVASSGVSPLFTGSITVSSEGVGAFDATQPVSATNFVTVNAAVAGNLVLSGGRVLSLTAAVSGSQSTPTPAAPDSLTATYSYSTPTGTALINATATYDATNGLVGTIKNNGGVTASFKEPVGGSLSGTVTDDGTATATVTGSMIFFSDGTSASLF